MGFGDVPAPEDKREGTVTEGRFDRLLPVTLVVPVSSCSLKVENFYPQS